MQPIEQQAFVDLLKSPDLSEDLLVIKELDFQTEQSDFKRFTALTKSITLFAKKILLTLAYLIYQPFISPIKNLCEKRPIHFKKGLLKIWTTFKQASAFFCIALKSNFQPTCHKNIQKALLNSFPEHMRSLLPKQSSIEEEISQLDIMLSANKETLEILSNMQKEYPDIDLSKNLSPLLLEDRLSPAEVKIFLKQLQTFTNIKNLLSSKLFLETNSRLTSFISFFNQEENRLLLDQLLCDADYPLEEIQYILEQEGVPIFLQEKSALTNKLLLPLFIKHKESIPRLLETLKNLPEQEMPLIIETFLPLSETSLQKLCLGDKNTLTLVLETFQIFKEEPATEEETQALLENLLAIAQTNKTALESLKDLKKACPQLNSLKGFLEQDLPIEGLNTFLNWVKTSTQKEAILSLELFQTNEKKDFLQIINKTNVDLCEEILTQETYKTYSILKQKEIQTYLRHANFKNQPPQTKKAFLTLLKKHETHPSILPFLLSFTEPFSNIFQALSLSEEDFMSLINVKKAFFEDKMLILKKSLQEPSPKEALQKNLSQFSQEVQEKDRHIPVKILQAVNILRDDDQKNLLITRHLYQSILRSKHFKDHKKGNSLEALAKNFYSISFVNNFSPEELHSVTNIANSLKTLPESILQYNVFFMLSQLSSVEEIDSALKSMISDIKKNQEIGYLQ